MLLIVVKVFSDWEDSYLVISANPSPAWPAYQEEREGRVYFISARMMLSNEPVN